MIKKCLVCEKEFDGNAKKKYCSAKCKKYLENSKRSAPKNKIKKPGHVLERLPSIPTDRPQGLSEEAGAFWDELAPVISKRGHLNILSKRVLEIYCILQAKINDIVMMIDLGTIESCPDCGAERKTSGNRSLLQLDDKWSIKDGTETQTFKESPYSMLLRQYTARSLDYAKQLYLTPLSNRGNFGLEEDDEPKKDKTDRFF